LTKEIAANLATYTKEHFIIELFNAQQALLNKRNKDPDRRCDNIELPSAGAALSRSGFYTHRDTDTDKNLKKERRNFNKH